MVTWARRRQFNYLAGVLAFFAVIGLILYFVYKPAPTCFDDKKNQNEIGVDCGGVCAKACVEQIKSLKIFWTRALKVDSGWYDLVAQVENLNENFGTRKIDYTFYLYDADNVLLGKRAGSTFVNSGERFVIFEGRVDVGDREVKKVFLEFDQANTWERIKPLEKKITLEQQEFTNTPSPLLQLVANNTSLQKVDNLQIIAVLYDVNKNALGASATIIDQIEPATFQKAYLTWPTTFADPVTTFETFWRLNSFELSD